MNRLDLSAGSLYGRKDGVHTAIPMQIGMLRQPAIPLKAVAGSLKDDGLCPNNGGDNGIRTRHLLVANEMLFLMSYIPVIHIIIMIWSHIPMVEKTGVGPATSCLQGRRSPS